ncbi:hypothetical protein LOSG293_080120 [Secundilactobacillus oryzae JCM 18671]|uniref:Cell surface protein n=1 Tax=Secundilactobacillus oryzae JCM 18671 TaxID=1291743 RepID=A0A081BHK8_9LACO|nr:hypothetical protein [Secundilactobacillus oryzae]GAK47526.1 hypothetical protein LOSG293_080120 [Secundilactobacillus oryzae JCM 18671]
MKKQLKLLLAIVTMAVFAIVGVSASQQNVHAASTYVQVGNWKLYRNGLQTQTYYKTTAKVSATVEWYTESGTTLHTSKVSLPKGTVVAGHKYSGGNTLNGQNGVDIAYDMLNYSILKTHENNQHRIISIFATKNAKFTHVKAPTYMPT